MKKTFLLLATVALFSCEPGVKKNKVAPPEKIDPKILVSCSGIGQVMLSDTHKSLEDKFPGEVEDHENTLNGVYTTVWEGSSKEVKVYWKEKQAPFKTIKYIQADMPGSPYMTVDSVKLGESLRDLVKINGSISIKFVNISQTDPGLIKSFNGGNIEKKTPCFTGVLEQSQLKTVHKDELNAFRKEKEVNSYDPLLNRIEFELVAMRVASK